MPIQDVATHTAALRHPGAVVSFLRGDKAPMHRVLVLTAARMLLGRAFDPDPWSTALREIESNELIAYSDEGRVGPVGNSLDTTFGKWIYCCVRVLRPAHMIETGVAHGYSSWVILNAMHKNGMGRLYSIDLPSRDTNDHYNFQQTPATGWMVPVQLKNQWQLILGDARTVLPQLLEEVSVLDIFFHDSDHSYQHMCWEFGSAWPKLRVGGLLISDDVHGHRAFDEFVVRNAVPGIRFNKGGCAIRR